MTEAGDSVTQQDIRHAVGRASLLQGYVNQSQPTSADIVAGGLLKKPREAILQGADRHVAELRQARQRNRFGQVLFDEVAGLLDLVRHWLALVLQQIDRIIVRQLRQQHRQQIVRQAPAHGRGQQRLAGVAIELANVIQGGPYRRHALMLGVDLNVEQQRLTQTPVEQHLQLTLEGLAIDAQNQVAAVLVDTNKTAFRRRRNGQPTLAQNRALLAQADHAAAFQGDPNQVVATDIAGVDFHRCTVVQIEQRRAAEKHAIQLRLQGAALLHFHLVGLQVMTDPILDLAKPAGTQKAMMTERRVLIEHAEAPPENDTVTRRHVDNLVEMESNFHATQTLSARPEQPLRLMHRVKANKGLKLDAAGNVHAPSMKQAFKFLTVHRKTFFCHYLGFSFYAMTLFCMLSWTPAFYMRKFGLAPSDTGYMLGIVVLLANTSGVFCGGWLIDWLAKKGYSDAPIRAGVIGAIGMAVPAIAFTKVSELWMSVALLAPAMFFASFPMPASTAAMQILPPNQMRAQISALFLLISNLIGLGLGTTLVALLTDRLFKNPAMVGSSISLLNAFAVALTLLLLIKGCRHFRESLKHEGLA